MIGKFYSAVTSRLTWSQMYVISLIVLSQIKITNDSYKCIHFKTYHRKVFILTTSLLLGGL